MPIAVREIWWLNNRWSNCCKQLDLCIMVHLVCLAYFKGLVYTFFSLLKQLISNPVCHSWASLLTVAYMLTWKYCHQLNLFFRRKIIMGDRFQIFRCLPFYLPTILIFLIGILIFSKLQICNFSHPYSLVWFRSRNEVFTNVGVYTCPLLINLHKLNFLF